MLNLRERLGALKDEALAFFAHAENGDGETIRPNVAGVMAEMASAIRGTDLLGPTALSSHQKNTRRMDSALRMKRYDCWDQYITYNEDTPIGRTQAGEEEHNVSVGYAKEIFLEAFEDTIRLLDLAQPPDPGTGVAQRQVPEAQERKIRNRGPKPDYENASRVAEIVARVATDGEWRGRLDDICQALDEAQIPFPARWRKRDRSCNGWAAYDERANAVKAIEYRLDIARQRKKTVPETLS
jgi:hypothetical protein